MKVRGYLRVGINALDHVCLLADHGCELPKDGAQLIDGGLDRLDRLPSLLDVLVRAAFLHHLELHLLVRHGVEGDEVRVGGRPPIWCAVERGRRLLEIDVRMLCDIGNKSIRSCPRCLNILGSDFEDILCRVRNHPSSTGRGMRIVP